METDRSQEDSKPSPLESAQTAETGEAPGKPAASAGNITQSKWTLLEVYCAMVTGAFLLMCCLGVSLGCMALLPWWLAIPLGIVLGAGLFAVLIFTMGGSTVFEMGVASTIYLALFLLLIPVFSRARDKARQTQCAANIKNIALAALAYQQDFDGALPTANTWADSLKGYLPRNLEKASKAYSCPAIRNAGLAATNYAFNSELPEKKYRGFSDDIARVPIIYDSTATGRNPSDAFTSLPSPGRHAGGNNVGFADGHVRWLKDGFRRDDFVVTVTKSDPKTKSAPPHK